MSEINLNHITKIEGHAKLHVVVEKGKIEKCELGAIEGSRYFEGLLKDRMFYEASEISSRICGICSCAHTVAALMAVERALHITVSSQTKELRDLLTLSERLRSHATHLYFLALPDYLGYESALAMVPDYKKEVLVALKLMKLGNEMVRIIGGRDLHPVSATVGGFLKLPTNEQLRGLAEQLREALPLAEATFKLFAGLKYPAIDYPTQYLSLSSDQEYAMLDGGINCNGTLYAQKDFHDFIAEYHESYSTANFVVKDGKRYMVGALARLNNNRSLLMPHAKRALESLHWTFPVTNPYLNVPAQAIEIIHAIEHSIKICSSLEIKEEEPLHITFPRKGGHGIAAIEVPRGVLWHEYTISDDGVITYANIVTPTAQNLRNMQEDIREILPSLLHLPKATINLQIEKLIRAYDPCFSCSTHFLEVDWEEK